MHTALANSLSRKGLGGLAITICTLLSVGMIGLYAGKYVSMTSPGAIFTMAFVALLVITCVTSAYRFFFLMLLLLPYYRFLGAYLEPLFSGTSYFLSYQSLINVSVIGYTVLLFVLYKIKGADLSGYTVMFPIAIYCLAMLISTIYSPSFFFSLRSFFRLGMAFFFYFLAILVAPSMRSAERMIKFLVVASLVQILVGFSDPFLLPKPLYEPYSRARSTMGHPNNFASYIAVCAFMITFLRAKMDRSLWTAPSSLGYISILFINMVLTIARSSWIAMLVSITTMRRFFRMSTTQFGFSLAVLVAIVLFNSFLWDRIEWRVMEERGNVYGRMDLSEYGIQLFQSSPIIGHGHASYMLLSSGKFGSFGIDELGIEVGNNSHNEYIEILVARGLFGIALFVWLLYAVAKLGKKMIRTKDPWLVSYGQMILSLLVFSIVLSFFDGGFYYTGAWLWAFVGMGDVIYKRHYQEKSNNSKPL